MMDKHMDNEKSESGPDRETGPGESMPKVKHEQSSDVQNQCKVMKRTCPTGK